MRPSTATALASVVIGAILVPVAAAAMARHQVSASDWASMELFTRDVLSRHPPLTGAWSRYGWAHPGPLAYVALAVPYRLFGGDGRAMQLAALLVNGTAMGAAAWLLRRRGDAAFVVGLVALAATAWSLPSLAVADYWNITLAVFPLFLTIVACWCRLVGDRAAGLVAVGAFALTLQAHVGMGLVVAPLAVVTLVTCVVRASAGGATDERRRARRGIALGAALALVLFLPVALDAARHWPGNAWRLVDWSLTNDEVAVGWSRAARAVGRATSLTGLVEPGVPSFVTVTEPIGLGFGPGAVLVLLVAAGAVSWRRGWRDELLLSASLLLTWAAALSATASIRGPFLAWLLSWMAPVTWLSWGAIGLVGSRMVASRAVAAALGHRARSAGRAAAAGAVALWLVLAISYVGDTSGGATVFADEAATIEAFTDAAAPAVGDGPVRIELAGDPEVAGPLQAALVNALDARGAQPRVAQQFVLQFGRHRVDDGPIPVLLIRDEPVIAPAPVGAEILAVADPLSAADRAEVDDLTARLDDLLRSDDATDDVRALLDTAFADMVLMADPTPAVRAASDDLGRLAELRGGGRNGRRLVLYLVP
ncbi:MAG: hypothetical protein ABW122_06945 [Ilumatobacteraceae bacterium]